MTSQIGRINRAKGLDFKGLTLMELLFVVVIMLVVVGISVPLFKKTYENVKLDDASQNIAKLMRYARERAIIERLNYKISFDVESKRYHIEVERDPLNRQGIFDKIQGKLGQFNTIPRDISIETARSEVAFYPDGTADEVHLYLSDRSGRTYTITSRGKSGYAEVFKYRKDKE